MDNNDALAATSSATIPIDGSSKEPNDSTIPSVEPTEADDSEDNNTSIAIEDEEDALFTKLEQDEQQKELEVDMVHPHDQPKQVTDAPVLLQKALKDGEVKASDSEEDSVKDNGKNGATNGNGATIDDSSATHHFHQRASQLDFLISKATEYSNFIAKDLDDLQAAMTDKAREEIENGNGNNKRKPAGRGRGGKKQKTSKAAAKMEDALVKDTKFRSSSNRAIFIQPKNLGKGCILKDYQLEGVRWMASLFQNGVSGILSDEMGLGKTIQCVALIAHLLLMGVSGPFLIVAPLATLPNWVREFEKWLPGHPVIRYHGTAQEREAMMKGPLNPKLRRNPDFPFIVTSYEISIRDQNKLEKLSEYTYLIVDEGHRLKNHRCTLLSSLKRLKAANRLLLTGTPIQNTLDELWSLLNFVNPVIFDDLSVFQSWFGFRHIGQKAKGGTDEESILFEQRKNQTVSKLHDILRPFLLRRIKTDVLSEMPPKKEVIVYSGLSKLQSGYGALIDNNTLRDTLLNQGIEGGSYLSQHNKLMNHRKNVNHPFLFGEPIDPSTGVHMGTVHPQLLVRASGKFALMDRMLQRLHKDGHQVLIFSQMTRLLNIIEDYLRFRSWNYCRIDGSTKIDERQRQMDNFNAEKTSGKDGLRNYADDRIFAFLLSTRAGGLGINLTSADTVIIFDSDWNPHVDSQAMDRCHRLGQERPVAVYRLLTVSSVDIDMMEKQISKKKLDRMTIAGGDFRKAGRRSKGDISFEQLTNLLASDIKDMNAKGTDVEDIRISEEEFDMILDRKRLFDKTNPIPLEGKMYDVIDAAGGDTLGSMET